MTLLTPSRDSDQVGFALDTMSAGLDRIAAGLATLRAILSPPAVEPVQFDPKDAANKYSIGGLEKLTPRGVEICYRLFDKGMSRYGVKQAMGISFGAATHRHAAWLKVGGPNRQRQPLS